MIRISKLVKPLLVLFFALLVLGTTSGVTLLSVVAGQPSFAVEGRGNDVVRVAGDINYPPYEFMDQNGIYRGFNVNMLNAVFLEMEMDYELIPMKWEDALQALRKGEVDMIQGMTRTPEREGYYLFTEPLVTNSQAIFVRKDNQFIAALSDLRGRTATYQLGDVAHEILGRELEINALGFADQEIALADVLNGQADAFVGNRLTAIYYLQKMRRLEELKIVGETMAVTDYCMAVNPDQPELLNALNTAIKKVKANGTYDRIYKKWFGEQLVDYGLTLDQVKRVFYVLFGVMSLSLFAALVVRQWNTKLSREVALQTERIRAQEAAIRQLDKMQTVGNLAAGIAHELRNPLTSIKALSELVPLKRSNDRFIEEFNEIVPAEIARMDQLIADLLDYARPKAPEPREIDLASLVENLERLVKPRCENGHTVITHQLEASRIYADPNQLKQILLNLVLNSLDAIEGGGQPGNIQITSILRGDQGMVELTVADNGPGMNAEEAARAFEPFVTSKRSGYGLGLPMVEQLTRENNGTISIESTPGVGTRVVMLLPAFEERGSRI
ncbi:transporter substrate-binding domain-containing protein [Acidaminobacter hydrogenoformans]|uniref:histidine kinase n=1 Tax=Acidaminobacter hydrogenoformans DSM 2784 TaxID=1120920 RepID=A0A1G5S0C3_9FIRM|nr:transporter substrate-binding domain-containing protein [Acidaminobacter hydrogenoformans]SCZ79029.1 His Kinase A (phospho-acceptor) domain-containing protein [Acidaminobacter hydrogenoformans DSM 2784]